MQYYQYLYLHSSVVIITLSEEVALSLLLWNMEDGKVIGKNFWEKAKERCAVNTFKRYKTTTTKTIC